MRPSNRITNYVITFAFGVIALGAGVLVLLQAIYWCYQTTTGEKEFILSTCIIMFSIGLIMLAIGYAIIKSAQKT
jgi:hypothetical protein